MDTTDISSDVQKGLEEDMARGLDVSMDRLSIIKVSPGSVVVSVQVTGFENVQQMSLFRELVLDSVAKNCLLPSKYDL